MESRQASRAGESRFEPVQDSVRRDDELIGESRRFQHAITRLWSSESPLLAASLDVERDDISVWPRITHSPCETTPFLGIDVSGVRLDSLHSIAEEGVRFRAVGQIDGVSRGAKRS